MACPFFFGRETAGLMFVRLPAKLAAFFRFASARRIAANIAKLPPAIAQSAFGYLKKSPSLITGHSPSIDLCFAARNAASHSARV
jgi:hypothetical protein